MIHSHPTEQVDERLSLKLFSIHIFICLDLLDFNTSAVVATFPADEGRSVITDLSVDIRFFDDNTDEANIQYFVVSLETVSAINVKLISLGQRASACQIIDNDRKY